MGVLNVTPDSFSDGGSCFVSDRLDLACCRKRVEQMLEEGASIIDVGGESTRPGAHPVSIQEEMDRVLPVIELLSDYDVIVSLDSSKPQVMEAAAHTGLGLINDVRALQEEGAIELAAKLAIPVCLMHMQGSPATMQQHPFYDNVVSQVSDFLQARIEACRSAGVKPENILIDPGFGFGKSVAHNMDLVNGLIDIGKLGFPVVAGFSRKSMISHLLRGRDVNDRLAGSLALAVMAVERGAWIIRAHDIKQTVDALTVASAIVSHSVDSREH